MVAEKNKSMLRDLRGVDLGIALLPQYEGRIRNLRRQFPDMPLDDVFKQALEDALSRDPVRVSHDCWNTTGRTK